MEFLILLLIATQYPAIVFVIAGGYLYWLIADK